MSSCCSKEEYSSYTSYFVSFQMDHSLEDIFSFTRQTIPETAAHHHSRNFLVICSTSVKGDLVQSLSIFSLQFTYPGP